MIPCAADELRVVAKQIAAGVRGFSRSPSDAASDRCVVFAVLDYAMVLLGDDRFHRFLLTRVHSVLDGVKDDKAAFASPEGYDVMHLTPCIWLLSAVIAFVAREERQSACTFASVVRRGSVAYVHRPTAYYGLVARRAQRAHLVHEAADGRRLYHVAHHRAAGKTPNPVEWQTFDRSGLAQLASAASLVVNFFGHISALTDPKWAVALADWAVPATDVPLRHIVPAEESMGNREAWVSAGGLALINEYDKLLGGHPDTGWVAGRALTAPHGAGHNTLHGELGKAFPQRNALLLRMPEPLCMTPRPPATSRVGLRGTLARADDRRQRTACKMLVERRRCRDRADAQPSPNATPEECRALAHTVLGLTELPSLVCTLLLGVDDGQPLSLPAMLARIDELLTTKRLRLASSAAAFEAYVAVVADMAVGPTLPVSERLAATIRYTLLEHDDAGARRRRSAAAVPQDGRAQASSAERHGDDPVGTVRQGGGGDPGVRLDDGLRGVVCV